MVINLWDKSFGVEIKKTQEYLEKVKGLSELIKRLQLDVDRNDKLIQLILDQNEQLSLDSFLQGFKMGMELMKNYESEEHDNGTL